MVRISSHSQEIIAVIIRNVFAIHFSYLSFNLHLSYDAFNADDLYKTSRQKLQIEKVIIPIL